MAHEVAQEDHRAAQDADKQRLSSPVVFRDALPQLAHLLLDVMRSHEHGPVPAIILEIIPLQVHRLPARPRDPASA